MLFLFVPGLPGSHLLHKQGFVHVETWLSKTALALGVNFSSSFESPAVTLLERARLGLGNNWVQLRYQVSFQEISASKRARTAVSWEKKVTAHRATRCPASPCRSAPHLRSPPGSAVPCQTRPTARLALGGRLTCAAHRGGLTCLLLIALLN